MQTPQERLSEVLSNLGFVCTAEYADNIGSHSVFERDPWDKKIIITTGEK
jgi:hypothetical protein